MSESRTAISAARSYREIGEYWDQHDLAEFWDQTRLVEIELDIHSSAIYFPLDRALMEKIRTVAQAHGVSTETLLNLWIQQRVAEDREQK